MKIKSALIILCVAPLLVIALLHFHKMFQYNRATESMKQCHDNRRQLDQLLEHQRTNIHPTTLIAEIPDQPAAYNHRLPVCPAGGVYCFGESHPVSVCSVHHVAEMRLPKTARNATSSKLTLLDELLDIIGVSVRTSSRRLDLCRNNRRQLSGAIEQWSIENGKSLEQFVAVEELSEYFSGGSPKCPHGGNYVLRRVADLPLCTILEHVSPDTSQ